MENSNAESILRRNALIEVASLEDVKRDYQAYQILRWGFIALPIVMGADKFTLFLCDWEHYLAPAFGNILGVRLTMEIVGVIEIVAGIGVALKPRWFAPVVAAWLWAIIVNLLLLGTHFDVAVRDLGLSLAALSLWRLAQHFDAPQLRS